MSIDPSAPIPVLLPDLPHPEEYLPELLRIHAARHYTNFGPCVTKFEAALQAHLAAGSPGVAICTANTGTAALQLLLAALELPVGARVLVPSLSFPASAQAVIAAGLEPVLVGVCPVQWRLTPVLADEILQRVDAVAVMPVATFGMPVDAQAWSRWSQKVGVPVLVDAAAAFDGQCVAPGCHAAFSLHATKSFGIGEGGLMASCDQSLLLRARQLSNFGFATHSAMAVARPRGGNGKLAELPAAVGLAQLRRWPDLVAKRQTAFALLAERIARLDGYALMPECPRAPSVFVVDVRRGPVEVLAEDLRVAGIATRRWYYPPLHRHPALSGLTRDPPSLSAMEPLCERLLGLPFGTFLDVALIERISAGLDAFQPHALTA